MPDNSENSKTIYLDFELGQPEIYYWPFWSCFIILIYELFSNFCFSMKVLSSHKIIKLIKKKIITKNMLLIFIFLWIMMYIN